MKTIIDETIEEPKKEEPIKVEVETVTDPPAPEKKTSNNTYIFLLILLIAVIIGIYMWSNAQKKNG